MAPSEPKPYRFYEFIFFPNFRYYTLKADDEEESIAIQTLDRLQGDPATSEMAERFLDLMYQIGERCRNISSRGMLRTEIQARALPPEPWAWRHVDYLEELERMSGLPAIRWYGFDADNRILLLFGGGLKTHNDPTQCPNVAGWFRFANRASSYMLDNRSDWAVKGLDLFLTDERFPIFL